MDQDNPRIAIFDSGVGGLTVLRELRATFPDADFLYLGDTARVPYGTKSTQTVCRYAVEAATFLQQFDLSAMVVACNSASAVALDDVVTRFPGLPVFGVIAPGAAAAAAASQTGKIGVLGTEGTVRSNAYKQAINAIRRDAVVWQQACPLFVSLAEEGWVTGDVPILVARRYLEPLLEQGIDVVVLGCTHYPLLRQVIQDVVGPDVTVVDSAGPLALALTENRLQGRSREHGLKVFTTDDPARFVAVGESFLGSSLGSVSQISLEPVS